VGGLEAAEEVYGDNIAGIDFVVECRSNVTTGRGKTFARCRVFCFSQSRPRRSPNLRSDRFVPG